jgi:hypothetical protein
MPGLSEQETYNELSYYTLSHGDPSFIHQYIVDAYAAQYTDEKSKPIKVLLRLSAFICTLKNIIPVKKSKKPICG